jgi:hypothetical protein
MAQTGESMMRTMNEGSLRARQRGRAALVMGLVSVLIVALVAKVTLSQFGLTPQSKLATVAATTGDGAPGAPGEEASAEASPPTMQNSVDKARAVQGVVQRQAEELTARIEAESK